MIKHRRAIALGFLVAGIATAVAAQAEGDKGRRGGGQGERRAERLAHADTMFRMLDADRDGRITSAEVEARRKTRFASADADGDGRLSIVEFDVMRRAMETERMFARLDADADGLVSDEEVSAYEPRMLKHLDADGDGVVTRDEALASHHGRGMMHRD